MPDKSPGHNLSNLRELFHETCTTHERMLQWVYTFAFVTRPVAWFAMFARHPPPVVTRIWTSCKTPLGWLLAGECLYR